MLALMCKQKINNGENIDESRFYRAENSLHTDQALMWKQKINHGENIDD